ncbi:MAG: zinc-ribbon domain-containing protein [Clostridia bacterium]|nr:zinc-ribbon domain-containing protein [Clostridia bacterium]
MKICPHCGKQLKDDAEFCFSCGREQPAASGASKKERKEKPARESAKAAGKTGGAEASVN